MGLQSVKPLSERQASSSNDHLHDFIPAEEVWPNTRIDFKEVMLYSAPARILGAYIKTTLFVLLPLFTILELPKKMAFTRHRRSNLDLLQSHQLRSRNVPLASQQLEAHCPDPETLNLRDEASHSQSSVEDLW
jgi:hypothetical protein